MSDLKDSFSAAALSMALAPLTILWSAYVLATLWGWFLVEAFALPAMPVPVAAGVMVVAGLFKQLGSELDRDPWGQFGDGLLIAIIRPAMALGFGWIFSLFV